MPENLIFDTGFWIGLYDSGDSKHQKAIELAIYLDKRRILIPWPSLYETLGTQSMRHPERFREFEQILSRPETVILPDQTYRDDALAQVFPHNQKRTRNRRHRGVSLVDMVIRAMIEDTNIKIDAMITFNRRDFFDVCQARNIEIISD